MIGRCDATCYVLQVHVMTQPSLCASGYFSTCRGSKREVTRTVSILGAWAHKSVVCTSLPGAHSLWGCVGRYEQRAWISNCFPVNQRAGILEKKLFN